MLRSQQLSAMFHRLAGGKTKERFRAKLPFLKDFETGNSSPASLNSRTCRWPVGDPTKLGFHYCGQAPKSPRPYCDAHERKSYQPLRSRPIHRPRFPSQHRSPFRPVGGNRLSRIRTATASSHAPADT